MLQSIVFSRFNDQPFCIIQGPRKIGKTKALLNAIIDDGICKAAEAPKEGSSNASKATTIIGCIVVGRNLEHSVQLATRFHRISADRSPSGAQSDGPSYHGLMTQCIKPSEDLRIHVKFARMQMVPEFAENVDEIWLYTDDLDFISQRQLEVIFERYNRNNECLVKKWRAVTTPGPAGSPAKPYMMQKFPQTAEYAIRHVGGH